MGLVRSIKKRIVRAYERATAQFYVPGPSCQIAGLSSIYETAFGKRRDGVFVEVGAFDGEANSNTAFLADIGWRGLYIEPVPEFAAACRARHAANNVEVINVAAGATAGRVEFQIARALTTSVAAVASAQRELDWAQGSLTDRRIEAPVLALEQLVSAAGIPAGFEILVVDVEGAETAVFDGFDIAKWRPQMMIVELADDHPDFGRIEEIAAPAAVLRRRLGESGYKTIYRDAINTVFVRMA